MDRSEEHAGVFSSTAGKKRILVVDDEDLLVELNRQRLNRLGYEVVATTSSKEALEIFREEPDTFDLVVTDFTMPHMTGMDLAMELLRLRGNIPIIICTGYSEDISPTKAKEAGIQAFLMKPLENREMAEAVRHILDERS
ncbi:MAG TPA: response regulator [Syntrophorhabdaceae bacterium]